MRSNPEDGERWTLRTGRLELTFLTSFTLELQGEVQFSQSFYLFFSSCNSLLKLSLLFSRAIHIYSRLIFHQYTMLRSFSLLKYLNFFLLLMLSRDPLNVTTSPVILDSSRTLTSSGSSCWHIREPPGPYSSNKDPHPFR